jgi:hypothetical protein
MRTVKPESFLKQDILSLARDGKPRMALVADTMYKCDVWVEDAQGAINDLLAEGKLIEEESGWIKSAATTSKSRTGTPFSPYRVSTGSLSGK